MQPACARPEARNSDAERLRALRTRYRQNRATARPRVRRPSEGHCSARKCTQVRKCKRGCWAGRAGGRRARRSGRVQGKPDHEALVDPSVSASGESARSARSGTCRACASRVIASGDACRLPSSIFERCGWLIPERRESAETLNPERSLMTLRAWRLTCIQTSEHIVGVQQV